MKQRILEKFIRYVKINTQSKDDSDTYPSTKCQFDLADILVPELKELGLVDAHIDNHGYVIATLPSNVKRHAPTIGLIAHMDTSPEVSGEHVKPQVIEKYDGGDIVLNRQLSIVMKLSENEELKQCIGHTLVTTDGTTLLGADDKAGIAAIMTMLHELLDHPQIPHGEIKIAFTPDEEIGKGVEHFDIAKFGAHCAYTVDGGLPGEINMETFSANAATVTVIGRNIHPGTAKNVMVNSIRVVSEIIAALPKHMRPETTEGYEPFIHPMAVEGGVEKSSVKMILRDFDTKGLEKQKIILETIINEVQQRYPKAGISLDIKESYRNMREELEKHPQVTHHLFAAAQKAGVSPYWNPIRGGTDGSRLTAMGLPTPNMFTGSANHHSSNEWLSVDALAKAVETLLNLVQEWCL